VYVFISHAGKDTWIAHRLSQDIQALGAETFLDAVDVETGDEAEARMRDGLDRCSELVVLLTPNSVDRPYVWIEIGVAWIQRKRIIGILYGLTRRELVSREGAPALLQGIQLRELTVDDVGKYLKELERRIK
jgi:hypothetical protein